MRLAQGIEGQFDTAVVAAFEAILAGASEDYRMAMRADFTLDAQNVSLAEDGQASTRPETPQLAPQLQYASAR